MTVKFSLLSAGYCLNHENLSMAGGRRIAIKFPAMVGLIEHPQAGPVLFDTGYANYFFEETRGFPGNIYAKITPVYYNEDEGIARQLLARGIKPEDVSLVILSHFHADHVAGVKDFPRARYVCYESAFKQLRVMNPVRALTHGFLPGLLPKDFESRTTALEQGRRVELPEKFRPFTEGVDLFGDRSVVAVDLPGHALGHFGILVDAGPRPYFLVGDACWHSRSVREDLMPHWLPQRIVFSDRHAYRDSLHRLHLLQQGNQDLIIVPSHCGEVYDALVQH
jgi:glyoxylase-like metal-dependent hydrolase (beta-lactamase superfamily II)